MLVKEAGSARSDRYNRWYDLLKEEVDLLAAPGARVIAVGNAAAEHLRLRGFPRKVSTVVHYSPLAGMARAARLVGHEAGFREFESSISMQDVLATAREVLDESQVPHTIREESLARLTRTQLTESRRKLVYCYKLDFDAIKAGG